MANTKTNELESIIGKVQKMDDILLDAIETYLDRFNLKIDMNTIDGSLKEMLSLRAEDLVDRTIEELQKYLINISKWTMAVNREINLRKVYADKKSNDYESLLVSKKRSDSLNMTGKKTWKSEKEKEDYLLATDERLEKANQEKNVAKAFYEAIAGYDDNIQQWHFSIQRVLIRKESFKPIQN